NAKHAQDPRHRRAAHRPGPPLPRRGRPTRKSPTSRPADHGGRAGPPRARRSAGVGTPPLAPFDSVDLPHPNSREQLAAALRTRGFFPADAPEGTQPGGAIPPFHNRGGSPPT